MWPFSFLLLLPWICLFSHANYNCIQSPTQLAWSGGPQWLPGPFIGRYFAQPHTHTHSRQWLNMISKMSRNTVNFKRIFRVCSRLPQVGKCWQHNNTKTQTAYTISQFRIHNLFSFALVFYFFLVLVLLLLAYIWRLFCAVGSHT